MIGGLSQAPSSFARETAQIFGALVSGLADAGCCGNDLCAAVVHSSQTRTDPLHRYPSFEGRSTLPLSAPPFFFRNVPGRALHRRSFAHARRSIGPAEGTGLHLNALSFGSTRRSHNRKGCLLCRLPNGSRGPLAPSHSQLAATHRLSKASSGQVLVRVRRSCWTATRSAVRLSAARQTCCIARAIPAAANARAVAGFRPQDMNRHALNHRAFFGSGGFFMSEDLSSAGQPARSQAPEGT